MYYLLALFFISLFGIIIMIGRKLALVKSGEISVQMGSREKFLLEVPHLEKIKHFTIKNLKKYGRIGLVTTLRVYVRSSNFLKYQYQEIKIKIKNAKKEKNLIDSAGERNEASKFLKMISDYKHKIRELKHKIYEEENNS